MVKRLNRVYWFVFFAVLISAQGAEKGAVFYVATDGNDAWSGKLPSPNRKKSDGPFATLTHARDETRATKKLATIFVRGGTYFLSEPLVLTPQDSGITISAYRNEKPAVSGGRQITDWKKGDDALWVADLPEVRDGKWNFRELFVNGERRFRPRLPREGYYRVAELVDADSMGRYDQPSAKFRFAPGDLRSDWRNLKDIEVVVLHFWVDTHLPIESVSDADRVVTFSRKSRRKLTDDHGTQGARYYVDNVAETLAKPGDWYLDRKTGTVRYLPNAKEKADRVEVIAPNLTNLIRLEGEPEKGRFVENISLRGLEFSHNQWELPPQEAGDLQAAVGVPGAIYAKGTRQLAIEDCRFKNLGTYGIELSNGCSENRIVGNEFADLGAGGIKISGGDAKSAEGERTHHNIVTDNHMHDLGQIYHSAVGILLRHAAANTLAHNHIHHLYYTGISVGWVWGYAPSVSRDNRIENNHIHDVGQGLLSDMGGIYTLGVSPGTIIRGNHIHDIQSHGYGGWGIYTDEGSTGILIENNLVYRTKTGGFHQHYGRENIVRNNIFAFAKENQIARSRKEDHSSFTFERNIVYWKNAPLWKAGYSDKMGEGYTIDHNLYFDASGATVTFGKRSLDNWRKLGLDVHSIIADPMFVAPEKADFTLKKGSPAEKIGFKPFDSSAVGPRRR